MGAPRCGADARPRPLPARSRAPLGNKRADQRSRQIDEIADRVAGGRVAGLGGDGGYNAGITRWALLFQ